MEQFEFENQKLNRSKVPPYEHCRLCKRFHELGVLCPVEKDKQALEAVMYWRKESAWARGRHHDLLTTMNLMHGKLAMLKHENNKLRKANEKLRKNLDGPPGSE